MKRTLLATLLITTFLWPGAAWADTLRVLNNPFEGKVIERSGAIFAALGPLSTALGLSIQRSGEGWLIDSGDTPPATVPAGNVWLGGQLVPLTQDDSGEDYVSVEAFSQALGGEIRRSGGEWNLSFSGTIRPAGAAVDHHAAQAPSQVSRDNPASFYFTQSRSASNPNAAPTTRDCGPTCMAMAALAFGRVPPSVNAADHLAIVVWCRQTMTGSTDDSNGTNYRQLETAANRLHLHPKVVFNFEAFSADIERGRMAIVGGDPGGLGFTEGAGKGHYLLVVGKDAGSYLVNDPGRWLRAPGTRLSEMQMQAFFRHAVTLGDK